MLINFSIRDYNPSTGRWMQKDPIGFGGQDTNLYRYVNNDPVDNIDPRGTIRLDSGIPNENGHPINPVVEEGCDKGSNGNFYNDGIFMSLQPPTVDTLRPFLKEHFDQFRGRGNEYIGSDDLGNPILFKNCKFLPTAAGLVMFCESGGPTI